MRRFIAAALLGLAATAPALADKALIVGIDIYQDSSLSFQLPNASFNDSERIRKLLTGVMGYRDEDILILRNEKANRAAILDGLNNWLGQTKPGERAFFYYVGHGHYQADGNGDEDDGQDETIVPFDAVIQRSNGAVTVNNMVVDDEIGDALGKLTGRQVTAVLDSCHSGTVTRSIGASPNMAARTPQIPGLTRSIANDKTAQDQKKSARSADGVAVDVGLVTWTAVSPSQLALIDEDASPEYRGLFTTAYADGIEKGLADKNGNGTISNQELLDYVRSRAADYCTRRPERCEMGVTPSLEGVGAATKAAIANPAAVATAAASSVAVASSPEAKDEIAQAIADPKAAEAKADPEALKAALQTAADTPKVEGVDADAIATAIAATAKDTTPEAVAENVGSALAAAKETAEAAMPKDGVISQGKPTPDKIMDLLGASLAEDVTIEQDPPSPLKLGAKNIRFRVTSPRDGFLILLSVSDDGEVVQLFPNAFSDARNKDGKILAGSPITIPDKSYGIRFDATSVTSGTVMALVAIDPLKLSRDFVTRKIDVIAQDEVNETVLPELAASLAAPAAEDKAAVNTKSVERTVATLRYEITR